MNNNYIFKYNYECKYGKYALKLTLVKKFHTVLNIYLQVSEYITIWILNFLDLAAQTLYCISVPIRPFITFHCKY